MENRLVLGNDHERKVVKEWICRRVPKLRDLSKIEESAFVALSICEGEE